MSDLTTQALPQEEAARLEDVLVDLQRELRGFLAGLPVEAQTASGLARALGVERTTCQRLVSAAMDAGGGLELVARLPGIQGMQKLIETARQRLNEPEITESAGRLQKVLDRYAETVQRLGGSRSQLIRRVRAGRPGDGFQKGDESQWREMLFNCAEALTGRSSDTWLAVHIYHPIPEQARRLMQIRAHGLLGHRSRTDAVPLTFHVFSADDDGGADDELGRFFPLTPRNDSLSSSAIGDDVPTEILREFSTDPPPIVRSRQPNEFMVQTVDAPAGRRSAGFDILFGLRGVMAHPAHSSRRLEEIWALVNFPVRRLLLDVFLHRSLARMCIPDLDVHLWRPDFAAHVGERWQTRFATAPRLQLLGNDVEQMASSGHERHVELLRRLFSAAGADPREYVGFRCDTAYPIWRTGYRISLDFGADGGGSDGVTTS